MKEIGRLREIAFRASGGGTGKSMDIDEYDVMDHPYKQLIVWNPEAEEILGGYRYLSGEDVKFDENGKPILATAHMFNFSEKFLKEFLPYTVELGRSFVTLEYQSTRAGCKAEHEVFLWKDDDVSEFQPSWPGHDSLFLEEAFLRQRCFGRP